MMMPITSGTQPPSGIFTIDAVQNAVVMSSRNPAVGSATQRDQPQRRRTST